MQLIFTKYFAKGHISKFGQKRPFFKILPKSIFQKIWPEGAVFQKFCQRANFKKYYAEKDILHFSKQLWLLTNPV